MEFRIRYRKCRALYEGNEHPFLFWSVSGGLQRRRVHHAKPGRVKRKSRCMPLLFGRPRSVISRLRCGLACQMMFTSRRKWRVPSSCLQRYVSQPSHFLSSARGSQLHVQYVCSLLAVKNSFVSFCARKQSPVGGPSRSTSCSRRVARRLRG